MLGSFVGVKPKRWSNEIKTAVHRQVVKLLQKGTFSHVEDRLRSHVAPESKAYTKRSDDKCIKQLCVTMLKYIHQNIVTYYSVASSRSQHKDIFLRRKKNSPLFFARTAAIKHHKKISLLMNSIRQTMSMRLWNLFIQKATEETT